MARKQHEPAWYPQDESVAEAAEDTSTLVPAVVERAPRRDPKERAAWALRRALYREEFARLRWAAAQNAYNAAMQGTEDASRNMVSVLKWGVQEPAPRKPTIHQQAWEAAEARYDAVYAEIERRSLES